MFIPTRAEVISTLVLLIVIIAAVILWSNEPPCKHPGTQDYNIGRTTINMEVCHDK